MDDDITSSSGQPEPKTTFLADASRTELAELAWSKDADDETEAPMLGKWVHYRHMVMHWGGLALAVVLPLTAIVILGVFFLEHKLVTAPRTSTIPAASTPAPAAPPLDGTYRLDLDFAKQTVNGAPNPQPNADTVGWWAFRSLCRSTGCVATGTKLDVNNHQMRANPIQTAEMQFVNRHWQRKPIEAQQQYPQCLGPDGKSVVAGTDTQLITWALEPQLDGPLRGVVTSTVLTDECGHQGMVITVPVVAIRTGDTPSGVSVTDPAAITISPTTSKPASAIAGPVLDGIYRLYFDDSKQTANGTPTTGQDHETQWWAFRSLCISTGCTATGTQLDTINHQEATGGSSSVFHFIDNHCQETPSLQKSFTCPGGKDAAANNAETVSWSLEPQPDGTLHGLATLTILTDECPDQGMVYRTPISATRVGHVPPTVILADPALFTDPALFHAGR